MIINIVLKGISRTYFSTVLRHRLVHVFLQADDIDWSFNRRLQNQFMKVRTPWSYTMIKTKAKALAKSLEIIGFRALNRFVQKYIRRNELCYRKATHKAQEKNKSGSESCREVIKFLVDFDKLLSTEEFFEMLNMDETPVYFDSVYDKTISCRSAIGRCFDMQRWKKSSHLSRDDLVTWRRSAGLFSKVKSIQLVQSKWNTIKHYLNTSWKLETTVRLDRCPQEGELMTLWKQ